MKKYLLLIFIMPMLIISCKNDGGSTYAMDKRFNNFLKILPEDIKDDFVLDSKKYGTEYKKLQEELYTWIDTTIENEKITEQEVKTRIAVGNIEYNIETLLAREYERVLPFSLMTNVKNHIDQNLTPSIKNLEQDSTFSNKFNNLKKDEAIVNFTTDEAVFYYVWNYLLGLERPRRFQ